MFKKETCNCQHTCNGTQKKTKEGKVKNICAGCIIAKQRIMAELKSQQSRA